MLVPVSHADWQVLRAIRRTKGGAAGRTVRMVPSRRTKDGTFLTSLEERGLVERAGKTEPVISAESGGEPPPFAVVWRLTSLGEIAAEHGEYEDGRSGLSLPTPEEFAKQRKQGSSGNSSASTTPSDARKRRSTTRK